MVIIRPASSADVARLQDIERAAGELFRAVGLDAIAQDPPPDDATLLHHIHAGTAWVALVGDKRIGYALASIVDGEGHVDQVSIDPAHAGRRIGQRLIDEVCGWAAAGGSTAVTLTTFRDVPWNGPYYRRLGFVELADTDLGPELQAKRTAEIDAGLDLAPRIAMRRPL